MAITERERVMGGRDIQMSRWGGGGFKPCIAENGKLKFPVSARWLVKTITLSEMTKA